MCLRLTMFFYSGCQKRHHENVNFKLNNRSNVTTITHVLLRPYVRFQHLGQCWVQQVRWCTFYSKCQDKQNFAWKIREQNWPKHKSPHG